CGKASAHKKQLPHRANSFAGITRGSAAGGYASIAAKGWPPAEAALRGRTRRAPRHASADVPPPAVDDSVPLLLQGVIGEERRLLDEPRWAPLDGADKFVSEAQEVVPGDALEGPDLAGAEPRPPGRDPAFVGWLPDEHVLRPRIAWQ